MIQLVPVYLVGGFNHSEKYARQLGSLFPTEWNNNPTMFQTTNQFMMGFTMVYWWFLLELSTAGPPRPGCSAARCPRRNWGVPAPGPGWPRAARPAVDKTGETQQNHGNSPFKIGNWSRFKYHWMGVEAFKYRKHGLKPRKQRFHYQHIINKRGFKWVSAWKTWSAMWMVVEAR